jgi:hypothetical protein
MPHRHVGQFEAVPFKCASSGSGTQATESLDLRAVVVPKDFSPLAYTECAQVAIK